MAENIVLKTFKGGNVTPQDDAIIYQTAIPGAGIFKGCEVTVARGNILHVSQGFGMIKGRFFEMYENEISVQLPDTEDITLKGRIYIHLDLSNVDEPIRILATTADMLPSLDGDNNINYNNTSYDLELATFSVDSTSILNLNQTALTLTAGGGEGGGVAKLKRDTEYVLGDVASCDRAPNWCTLVCTIAGTTASLEPNGYAEILKYGDTVLDGTCVFTARNTYGELDDIVADLSVAMSDIDNLTERVSSTQSDMGSLIMRLISLEDYRALETYAENVMYYCYENPTTKQITAIFLGGTTLYSTGIEVTYHVDTNRTVTQLRSLSEDVVAVAPVATLDGFTLVGWREDDTPSSEVLESKILRSDEPVEVYAVFERDIEIDMMGNGAELAEGEEEESFDDVLYYNNGNALSEGITIPKCPYEVEGKVFSGWNTDCVSLPSYKPGSKGQFTDDTILFPVFIDEEYEFNYIGGSVKFTLPADGMYEFEIWGAAGADAIQTISGVETRAKGGKGGHVKAYKRFNRGDVIYITNGGMPTSNTNAGVGGSNGGANGTTYTNSSTSRTFGAAGGGATMIASITGMISTSSTFKLDNKDVIYIVAGGGGGGGISGGSSTVAGTPNTGGDGGGERGGDGSGGALGGRQVSTGANEETGFMKTISYGNSVSTSYSGGGGGYFSGNYGSGGQSGAGGSGYVGGMPTFTLNKTLYRAINESGINDGNGRAVVRYVECM